MKRKADEELTETPNKKREVDVIRKRFRVDLFEPKTLESLTLEYANSKP